MGHEYTNGLANEQSPYLLQHAHNPVDWRPWNDETLALARREDKPIFLSIGYSTCHWCHVMARESFEDEGIAARMNAYFVNVKVDREERPDVDQAYMHAVQAMGQQGGWPLSVWLTPDLQPIYGGTYFPPASRFGRPGFVDVIERIRELWTENRDTLRTQARSIVRILEQAAAPEPGGAEPEPGLLDRGFHAFSSTFDAEYGGFGRAPKFPRPAALSFLLRYARRTGRQEALSMVVTTLRFMVLGGIHDHIGGGFARYSVDPFWRVPHFEKMLYDQAQIMAVSAQAYRYTGLPDLAVAIHDIAGYVQRDLTDPDGGFYSAEDADSADENGIKREGAFYTWTLEELRELLGEGAAGRVAAYYGMTQEGNFEHGLNVLHVSTTVPDLARELDEPEERTREALQESLGKMAEARARRVRPGRDDKVLTSWNGLMISGFSEAYRALGAVSCLASAQRAADFLLARLWNPRTRMLMRRYRAGDIAVKGFLDDHAFFAGGLLDLYEAALEPRYLLGARDVAQAMVDRLWDDQEGGFHFSRAPLAGMPRRKDDHDSAEPSGNSAAAIVCLRLAEFTGEPIWRERAERTISAFSGALASYPEMMPAMLCAVDMLLSSPLQVVIAGDREAPATADLVRLVQGLYLPNTTLLHTGGDGALASIAPWTAGMAERGGEPAAYVCRDFACRAPITNSRELVSALEEPPA